MSKFFKQIIIGFVIIFFIIVFHYISWLQPMENLAVRAISPIQRGIYSFSLELKSFYSRWLTKKDLLAENNKLEEELKNYQLDRAKVDSLTEENRILKAELNFTQEHQLKFVAAKIITGVSDPLSQSVVIDRGKKDGLTKGLAVVAEKGIVIGKINEVGDNFSKVLLLTDNKSKLAATIQNLDQTVGLVEGQFGLSLIMTNIPQDQEIKAGDLVVTSGLEGQIPKDLLIAKIANIKEVESEIFKTAVLSPIIPFNRLSYVLVVAP